MKTKAKMTIRMLRTSSVAALLVAGSAVAAAALQDQPAPNSATALRLPKELVVYGTPLKPVVKASVLVNGEVITQTDVDQRIAMLAAGNGRAPQGAELEQARTQVLAQLIDETLEIQAAKAEDIAIKPAEIDRAVSRFASQMKTDPAGVESMLNQAGSTIGSLRRQIEGEFAWRRLQSAKIESGVSVGEDEVKAVLSKLEASKGSEEYNVGEIFLASTGANRDQVHADAVKIIEAMQKGLPFAAAASRFSQSSTAPVGGDLGWVRLDQLSAPQAAAVVRLAPGTVSEPVEVPGGFSILALKDSRKVLVSDPRDAILNLKQVSIGFPKGVTESQIKTRVDAFVKATASIGGCGGADKLAGQFGGDVVQSDQVKLRELPEALQGILQGMQIGQATPPFGNPTDGVRVLLLCGRDIPDASMPTYDQVFSKLNDERVSVRARRYLRDLRRDAIIDYR